MGHRLGLDLVVLWLWCRPEAVAWILLLAWESPYATGEALQKRKKKKVSIQLLGLSDIREKNHKSK